MHFVDNAGRARLLLPLPRHRPRQSDAVTAADAVLLASPTYRGSLTSALKNVIGHQRLP
jgi:NAD(P)H-dependent FMN reductase